MQTKVNLLKQKPGSGAITPCSQETGRAYSTAIGTVIIITVVCQFKFNVSKFLMPVLLIISVNKTKTCKYYLVIRKIYSWFVAHSHI